MSLPLTSRESDSHDSKKRRTVSECLLSDRENELEWIVVDTNSATDSGTCMSGGSFDSSMDIDIGDLSKPIHGQIVI